MSVIAGTGRGMGFGMLRLLVGVALIVMVAALWLFQRRLIYLPTQRVPPIDGVLPGWEEVTFTTTDGFALDAWFREPEEGQPVVMVFGGNAGNRADRASLGRGLAAERLGVLLVDYRGYGTNLDHCCAASHQERYRFCHRLAPTMRTELG